MLHGQVNYNMLSSFLRELPDELLHWLSPRMAARGSFTAGYDGNAAAADIPAQRASAPSGWRIGQPVQHAKFGEGVVMNTEGSGTEARVQVNFRKAGTKWLALEYAKLTAV